MTFECTACGHGRAPQSHFTHKGHCRWYVLQRRVTALYFCMGRAWRGDRTARYEALTCAWARASNALIRLTGAES